MESEQLKNRTILLVHAGNTSKRFILQKLKKMSLRVICINKERLSSAQAYVDHWILADLNNHKESLDAIKHFLKNNRKIKIDGVVTFWDESVLLTSQISDALGLIGIPFNIAKNVKNKYNFRDQCRDFGVKSPKHTLIKGKTDIKRIEKGLSYPMVIKPVYGACSAFVMRVNNRQDFEETYDYIRSNIKSFWLTNEWENLELFVEEYIDGDEVDIDILLQNGKVKFSTISDNFNKSRERFFVDSGQSIPSTLPANDQKALIDMAEETLEKFGIQNGCIHFEAKITKDGPCPLEINMRMGGDYIYSYIKSAWSLDLVECSVKIALGVFLQIRELESPKKYIIGWDLQPEYSGILVELDVSEELNKKKYLEEIHFFAEIGDPILRPPEGYESLGWITVSGDNSLDAQDNLKEALSLIKYKVAEFDEESSLGKTSRKSRLSAAVMKKDLLMEAAKIEKVRGITLNNQRQLRIGIATNLSNYKLDNGDTEENLTALNVASKLKERGYDITLIDFNNISQAMIELLHREVDLVLNIAQGINNDSSLRPHVAAILESLHIPYTGTNSFNLALSRDRIRMKKLLNYHNIPTPKWDYAYTVSDKIDKELKYPLIVKPAQTDLTTGVTNASVVKNENELEEQLHKIIVTLGKPALVEEYIEGDEFSVCILGSKENEIRVLPLTRSIFKNMPKNNWHIYTYPDKFSLGRKNKKITIQTPIKNVSKKLESLITEIALDTYKVLQCKDYGRVDLRVDHDGNPYITELNCNPTLHPNSQFAKSAKMINVNYADLLEEIIGMAINRYKTKKLKYYSVI